MTVRSVRGNPSATPPPPRLPVSWGPGRIDVVTRGADGAVWLKVWVNGWWVRNSLGSPKHPRGC